jgi:beta-galactosidase
MKSKLRVLAILVCVAAADLHARSTLDLNGTWEFRADPQTVGDNENWASSNAPFPSRIEVPAAWETQGVGEREGILRTQYSGVAWYGKSVMIPSDWRGKTLKLKVGGVVRRAVVFVNGQRLGEHYGFSTPFSFDITKYVRPGENNRIVLRVANLGKTITKSGYEQSGEQPTGAMNYMGNWGGIYGNVSIEVTEPLHIEETRINPDLAGQAVRFAVSVLREGGTGSGTVHVEATIDHAKGGADVALDSDGKGQVQFTVPLPNARLWTPETPNLYQATLKLTEDGAERDTTQERFGMREITSKGPVLFLNGKPLYLRGVGDDSYYVSTGVPPASKQYYLNNLRLMRSFGFNAVRFHSTIPPSEYFEAADEVGVLILAELPAVYTVYFLPHKDFYWNEMERTLETYWNHPSFFSLALGDELHVTRSQNPTEFIETVNRMYAHAKSIDPKRFILSTDGALQKPTDLYSIYEGAPGDKPTIRHEFGGYYCSLPDPSQIPQFTGAYVPTWLEEKKKWVEDNSLSDVYPTYVRNSQRLQMLGRKFQVEQVRRRPEVTGYEYWLSLDYPGGTGEGDSWEEGWFDAFWRPKNIEPSEGKEINSPVLVMIDAGVGERTLWNGSRKPVGVWISNYGDSPIAHGSVDWELLASGKDIAHGVVQSVSVGLGQVTRVGGFEIPTPAGEKAQKLELALTLKDGSSKYSNRWSFWTYPNDNWLKKSSMPVASSVRWSGLERRYPFVQVPHGPLTKGGGLLITTKFDQEAKQYLEFGGRVWLMADRDQFHRSGDVSFFPGPGGAQGTAVQDHPSLAGFPHESIMDSQFFNLMEGAWWLPLDEWPKDFTPIAGAIHTTSQWLSKTKPLSRAGLIVEARVGKGKLLITTLNLRSNLDDSYPEALSLFDQLLRYVISEAFSPNVEIPTDVLDGLIAD